LNKSSPTKDMSRLVMLSLKSQTIMKAKPHKNASYRSAAENEGPSLQHFPKMRPSRKYRVNSRIAVARLPANLSVLYAQTRLAHTIEVIDRNRIAESCRSSCSGDCIASFLGSYDSAKVSATSSIAICMSRRDMG
jgi:predicted component of type VI protein secretion system